MKKIILLTLVSVYASGVSQTVTSSQPASPRSDAEQTVAILLADNGRAPIPGFVETSVNRLGDGAALGIIQYLGERKERVSEDPSSSEEVRRMLLIIRMAFAAPNIIQSDENRYPRATLVLLKYLSCLPVANAVKDDIASTNHLMEQTRLASKPAQ